MKNIFYIFTFSMLAVISLSAEAENTYVELSVNPDKIQVSDGKAEVEVWYDTDITTLNAFDLRLYVPAGFTIETNSKGKYIFNLNPDEDIIYDHQLQASPHLDEAEPYYVIVGLSMTNSYLAPGQNMLFSVNLIAPDDFTYSKFPNGEECKLSNITIAENRDMDPIGHNPSAASFSILPQDFTTGVNDLQIETTEDIIYNLEGMRVFRPLGSGIYIINGERTYVK